MTFPLTTFLIALLRTPPERLSNADPVKLAAKYGISPDHAAGYLRMECTR
jgi:hypothetical protein